MNDQLKDAKKIIRDYLSEIGRKGGKMTTPKKQAASRRNGLLGGRPKKEAGK
jgi:general stress protein YciG